VRWVAMALTLGVATLSWRCIERPILAGRKGRLAARLSTATLTSTREQMDERVTVVSLRVQTPTHDDQLYGHDRVRDDEARRCTRRAIKARGRLLTSIIPSVCWYRGHKGRQQPPSPPYLGPRGVDYSTVLDLTQQDARRWGVHR
jgi:hypothetical protein